jgi:hypothetical protein
MKYATAMLLLAFAGAASAAATGERLDPVRGSPPRRRATLAVFVRDGGSSEHAAMPTAQHSNQALHERACLCWQPV